jgi:transcriptional regulator with XRE-family HTH domain
MKESKVAELLISLRKEHGYTQSDLAEKLGISFQAVSKWERGENLPDAFTLVELADIYNISVDEILNGKVIPRNTDDEKAGRKKLILVLAVILIIAAPVSIFIFGVDNYTIYVPVILIITAISVGLMTYATVDASNFSNFKGKSSNQRRKEEIIYVICAGIFLTLGLLWNLFHIAWIIFVFGYALTLIVNKD